MCQITIDATGLTRGVLTREERVGYDLPMSKPRKGSLEGLVPTPFDAASKVDSPSGEGQRPPRPVLTTRETGGGGSLDTLAAGTKKDPESLTFREGADTDAPPPSVDLRARALRHSSFDERYRPTRTLGEGGMGEILLIHDEQIRRKVALKRLLKEASSPEGRARFEREGLIQAQLEHPNIVPVYDMGIGPDGESYFTMRRVHGRTLGELLHALREGDEAIRGHFGTHKLLNIFCTVCLTLEFAHSLGVIHRDLKPDNVMLGEFGEVNVLDWGLAKVAGEPEASPSGLAAALGKKTPALMDVKAEGASPTVAGPCWARQGTWPRSKCAVSSSR